MSGVDWNSIAIGSVMTAVTHPFTYAKVLVQLGYEPLAPTVRRNMYFRKQLQYPNVFQYLKHIRETDGFWGMYRGLAPRILANISISVTHTVASQALNKQVKVAPEEDNRAMAPDFSTLCKKTSMEMSAKLAAVVVSQPFHVIAIRSMAQFVGHETLYCSISSSVVEIYSDEGILGFFSVHAFVMLVEVCWVWCYLLSLATSILANAALFCVKRGIVPRLLSEIFSLWACNILTYAANKYILTESSELKDLREYTHMLMSYATQTIVYPLSVTSTVMATNGAKLAVARPPITKIFNSWSDCLIDLLKTGQANRGASMFFRKALLHARTASSVMPTPAPTIL